MKIHRIAVVGCGAIAQGCHLPNIKANPRLQLAVTCDKDLTVAEQARKTFGAQRACGDWHDVVADPTVDLIVLATHTKLRSQLILPALKAGKPVYSEKPLANTPEELDAIVQASKTTGVPVCVGHNRRSSPAILELRRLLEKARRGPGGWLPSVDRSRGGARSALPEEGQTQMLLRVNDDCRSWKDWVLTDSEGVAFAEMVHFIDLALWFAPAPPAMVFAMGSHQGNFTFIIRFQDGSLATLQHSMSGHFDAPKELIEITANHVTLVMDHHVEVRQRGLIDEPFRQTFPWTHGKDLTGLDGIEGFNDAVSRATENTRRGQPAVGVFPNKGHFAQLDRLLDCLEGKGENPCDAAGAAVVSRLGLELMESIRTGLPRAVDATGGPAQMNAAKISAA